MKNKITIISIIMLFSIMVLLPKSNAALESKPGTSVLVNTNVSNSYLLCQGMKGLGESLYGSTVQPHLATNKDWGAVSYLSNSVYGTNTKGGNNGLTVEINGVSYYSTNGNTSGVMNWGRKWTQTAGLISQYTSGNSNVDELYNNRNTKYVEYIDAKSTSLTKGMAMQEMSGKYVNFNVDARTYSPGSARSGLFGGAFGYVPNLNYSEDGAALGHSHSNITFRPVVWN